MTEHLAGKDLQGVASSGRTNVSAAHREMYTSKIGR